LTAGIGEVVEQYVTAETLESKTEQWIRAVENLETAHSALRVNLHIDRLERSRSG